MIMIDIPGRALIAVSVFTQHYIVAAPNLGKAGTVSYFRPGVDIGLIKLTAGNIRAANVNHNNLSF